MRFNKLDLNLLVALDALLSERSISRAAEKVHLSQSAMSNALSRLREYFDDELLVQVGRKMEPTPRAEGLADAVRDILVRVEASISTPPTFVATESTRVFRLLVSDFTLSTLIPHFLKRVYAQAPNVRIELCPQVAQAARSLERADVDMLIIPIDYCTGEHPTDILFEEDYCCVMWNEAALAGTAITREQYLGAGHIVVTPGHVDTAIADWFGERIGVQRKVEVTTFGFAAPAQLVVGTQRVATMHRRLADHARRSLPIVICDLPITTPKMQQAMQWHSHRSADPGLRWLRENLKASVLDMDGRVETVAMCVPLGTTGGAQALGS
ncbi:Nodulation protein D 2 [Pandoraea anapnoica]|uniref:Nodulation protein D 2 n=1 Tax=Pandoraea anapnoica TaxID=2508301 RepID=A0A5E4ZQL3_9BURK|nr:LysR family transcriptional regulator [Pandoraea anapnoica]VVE62543.1 Nodulation protein D 2 [Pandoraea anapnoica]